MTDNKDLSNLLSSFQEALSHYTVPELNDAIIEVLEKRDGKSILKNRVINAVCEVFLCNKRTLLHTSFRGNNRVRAAVLIVYLNKEYELTYRHIAKDIFMLDPSSSNSVWRIIKDYQSLNEKVKRDAEFLKYYAKVKNIVNGFGDGEKEQQ